MDGQNLFVIVMLFQKATGTTRPTRLILHSRSVHYSTRKKAANANRSIPFKFQLGFTFFFHVIQLFDLFLIFFSLILIFICFTSLHGSIYKPYDNKIYLITDFEGIIVQE